MNVTVEDLGSCRKRMRVEVPSNEVGAEIDKITKEFQVMARLPGFRPGKAPLTMVSKRYAKEIDDEVRKKVVPKSLHKALEDRKIHVLGVPEIEELNFERGLSMSYSVVFDTAPEFALPNYKGIALAGASVEPTDEEYRDACERLRQEYAEFKNVEGRPLQANDFAIVNIAGTVEGRPLQDISPDAKPWGERNDLWLRVSEDGWLPGFAPQLEGMSAGEKREVTITFAEDFPVKELAGKPAQYSVELKTVKERVLPELDEKFAQMVTRKPLEEFEPAMRSLIKQRKEADQRARHEHAITSHLVGAVQCDLPASVVQAHARMVIQDLVRQAQMQGATDQDITVKHQEIFESATKIAREQVAIKFILLRIAEAEKLEVTEAEIERSLTQLAHRHGMEREKLVEAVVKNNGFGQIEEEILVGKTLDFLLGEAQITPA